MFALTDQAIDTEALRREMTAPGGGALVVFEGHVRDHNQNRRVTRLDYEGAQELAANEFGRILTEVKSRFPVLQLRCVHRVGTLRVGDVAVWVGVVAEHRSDAFNACRYVVDELKQRLPIWKKEFYTDGDSGWLNAP